MRTFIEYGLANAVAATALALVAILVGRCTRRPAVRHALWVLVFVRLVMPPVWTVPLTLPAFTTEDVPAAVVSTNTDASKEPLGTTEFVAAETPSEIASAKQDEYVLPAAQSTAPLAVPAADAAAPVHAVSPYAWAAVVWLVGTAIVLIRAALRIRQFQRALLDASPAASTIQHQAVDIAGAMGLRHCPAILLVPGKVSPALWMPGLSARGAKLIVPAGLLLLLDAGQRASVLAHELAHLRRGDPWVRWLELIVVALYWWFPLLGWFRSQLRAAEEECCDLWVVAALRERRDYAMALVETAAFLSEAVPTPLLASGAGPVRHLQRRVIMIMRATWPAKLTRVGLAAVLGFGGLGLAFSPALAQDRGDERKSERGEERKAAPGRGDERPREPGKDRDERPGRGRAGGGSPEDVEKARTEVERAHKLADEALAQLRAAEDVLARLEGRPMSRDPFARGAGERGPSRPKVPAPPDVPVDPRGGPLPPGSIPRVGHGGSSPDLRELQQQVEELRRALDQMRQELRDGRSGDRKNPEPRGRSVGPTRPREEPKRPDRDSERRDF